MARGPTTTKSDPDDGGQNEQKTGKRRCVQSACLPCRKRKSKCDGSTPVCATCTAVYKTECYYDEATEGRRGKATTAVKRENPSAAESSENADFLIKSIRTLPESDVYELIQRIRKDQLLDIDGLAETWKKTVTLPFTTVSDPPSLAGDLPLVLGRPSHTQTGESRPYGHTSDENYTASGVRMPFGEYKNGTWTTVTQDIRFVERLLDLYFQWSHPFYVIFSRECFLRDFHSGRQKYCSPLLVNAILAYACHFTDDPAGRTDPDNFRTAGDHFFAEARKLLYEDEAPCLTTTQALCVMAMREPSAGRDSSGFMYVGRCIRMAVELGLHSNTAAVPSKDLTPSEIEVRKVTFWGCFTVDTVWSLSVGRISQLPRAAITLDKPILEESMPATYGAHQLAPGPITSRMFLQEFSSLSELINDNNFMYFAPKERLTSRRLLGMYGKYKDWYRNLPFQLQLPERSDLHPLPHIVVLHMLYHTTIVHLFRPMLKVDFIHSDVRPRDICIESANRVTDLLRLYRKHYELRACQLILTHILLSVSVVHLLYSQDYPVSSTNLVDSLQGLEDLSVCHYFGARSFKIVHRLAKSWNLPWPEALKLSKLVPNDDDASVVSPPTENFFHTRATPPPEEVATNGYTSLPPPALQTRRESLSMFAAERSSAMSSIHSPSHLIPSQQLPGSTTTLPFATHSTPAPAAPAPTAEHAETLFWTPMPGIGVPILPRSNNYQMSPMDLNNLLGSANEWDRYSRDGFKMSETWAQEPIGYTVHTTETVASATLPNGYSTSDGTDAAPSGPGYEWWGGGGGTSGAVG